MNQKHKLIAIVVVVLVVVMIGGTANNRMESSSEFVPTPLIINTPETNPIGWVICYDENGDETSRYYGDIEIVNDGSDGKKKEIRIKVVYDADQELMEDVK